MRNEAVSQMSLAVVKKVDKKTLDTNAKLTKMAPIAAMSGSKPQSDAKEVKQKIW